MVVSPRSRRAPEGQPEKEVPNPGSPWGEGWRRLGGPSLKPPGPVFRCVPQEKRYGLNIHVFPEFMLKF